MNLIDLRDSRDRTDKVIGMARFFFDLHECGAVYPDEDGQNLTDAAQARSIAIQAARDLMSEEVRRGSVCLACYIVISDAQRHEVMTVPFREALTITG